LFAVVTRKRPEFVGRAPHVREGCVIQCRRAPVRSSQSRWCVLNILSYWAAVFKKWISSNYPWVTIDPMCSRPTLAGRTGRPDQIPLLLPRNDPKTNPNPIQTMHFRRFFFKTNQSGELPIILKRRMPRLGTITNNTYQRDHTTLELDSNNRLNWDVDTVVQIKLYSIKNPTPRHYYPRRSRYAAHLASAVVPNDVLHRPAAAVQS